MKRRLAFLNKRPYLVDKGTFKMRFFLDSGAMFDVFVTELSTERKGDRLSKVTWRLARANRRTTKIHTMSLGLVQAIVCIREY